MSDCLNHLINRIVSGSQILSATAILESTLRLRTVLTALQFTAPVAHVYNPLDYAFEAYQTYIQRFGNAQGRIVLLGMNPGPWGMMQVGVPFGEVSAVRDWMGINQGIIPPLTQHPKRPIQGFECTRSEVSGKRLWSWAQEDFGTAEAFFEHYFVINYCPLVWLEAGGKNRTPEQLPAAQINPVYAACNQHLSEVLHLLKPTMAIGIGGFAQKRLTKIIDAPESGLTAIKVGTILHPSPASPIANRGWASQARAQLTALGAPTG